MHALSHAPNHMGCCCGPELQGERLRRMRADVRRAMQVLVAAQRSGAVDVNLTCANFVFMMEPGLNYALDAQAVGRAWRMGQTREVNVRRLFKKNTVDVPLSSSRHLRTCLQAVTLHMDQRLRGGNPDWVYVSAYSHVSPPLAQQYLSC